MKMRRCCCEILEPRRLLSASPIFSENFDEYPVASNWQVRSTNQSVYWQVVASGFGGISAHSGQYMASSIGYGYEGTTQNPTVPSGTNTVFYSPFDFSGDSNAYVSFWYNMPLLPVGSELRVNANTDGDLNDTGSLFTATTGTDGWVEGYVNLSAFAGQSPTLYFYYSGSGGEGAMLDDITVYTDTQTESIAPTAKLLSNLSDITTAQSTPLTFQVEYDDNTAIEPASVSSSNIAVLLNGTSVADAQLQSMQINSNGSIDATYSYLPSDGEWDGSAHGSYTLQLQSSSIFDTSGNAAAQTTLGSFNCTIPEPFDTQVQAANTNNVSGTSGSALPTIALNLWGSVAVGSVDYTADIYLVGASTISASDSGELLGEIPFNYSIGLSPGSEIDLNPGSEGLTIPSNLSPGTYSIGVHINAPSEFPDTNDANNWVVTGTVTIQPELSNPTIVTVMVLYTQQAANAVAQNGGGNGNPVTEGINSVAAEDDDSAIQQQINAAIATTNTALLNSDIDVQLQLVYSGEIDYTESGDAVTDLTNLSSGSGGLNQIPALREEYGANLVSLWTSTSDGDIAGEAYIGGSPTDENLGYSVVVAPSADAYTFSHEIGHNFGAGHAVGDSSGENSDNGLYSYSHGWRFTVDDGDQYHDIMAYPPGTTIPYYSNPNIDYLGQPTGTADANNALTISEDAANVALYGLPTATISASAPVPTTTEGGPIPGQFQITATIPNSISVPMTLNIPLTYTGTPSQSDYNSPPASVSITIPAGSTNASINIPITAINDGIHEPGKETLTLQITSGTQYTVGTASAVIKIIDANPPNPAFPVLGSIAASSATVTRKAAYKIVASGVAAGTEGGKISVIFYLNTSGADVFNSSDKILGTDKSSAGGWVFKGNAKTLPAGTQPIFAVAKDSDNNTSDPASCSITVTDNPPTIKKFTARVIPDGRANAAAYITATAADSDGKVTKLIVWVDSNDDGLPDDGEQTFTGSNLVRQLISVEPDQSYTISAIAYDNDGVASAVKNLTFGG
jgi:archaellum component FlaF (FlaF/FlaG flagellin family)